MKKLHPRFVEDSFEGDDFEDEEESFFVYSSDIETIEEESEKEEGDVDVDPRWNKLKDLNK
jgi:uncharacterized metal-binding protein YceD (DUF177 family)